MANQWTERDSVKKIRLARIELDLTQTQLAQKINIVDPKIRTIC